MSWSNPDYVAFIAINPVYPRCLSSMNPSKLCPVCALYPLYTPGVKPTHTAPRTQGSKEFQVHNSPLALTERQKERVDPKQGHPT